ncbi:MAG: hypothetical protein U0231_19755 [Nitrospiraceae bacterium]
MLTEIKARYIWLSTVLLNIIVPLCVSVLCALIIIRAHPARRLRIVPATGVAFAEADVAPRDPGRDPGVLYRAVFGFTYLTLQGSGYRPGPLLFAKAAVSFINVLAAITPVVAVLAACSIVAPPRQDMRTLITWRGKCGS